MYPMKDLHVCILLYRFTAKVDVIRLNRYSPLSTAKLNDGKYQRAWPHADFGILTLLFQDKAGDFEVQGSFIPIQRELPTEMSIYVSDTPGRMTKKHLRPGIH